MSTALLQWSVGSRRLAALYLVVLVPSAAILVWLGLQLLEQDRRLMADRDLERREVAADVIVGSLERTLSTLDAALERGDAPEGSVFVSVDTAKATIRPAGRILWLPAIPHRDEADAEAFAEGEAAEFRGTDDRGYSTYTAMARSSDRKVRSGALLRLARLHRNSGRIDAAIASHRELASFSDVAFHDMPADLLARRAICELLLESKDAAQFARETDSLRNDFIAGRWALDRAAWTLAAEDIERWTERSLDISAEQQSLTEALDSFWTERVSGSAAGGRQMVKSVLIQWRTANHDRFRAILISPSMLRRWVNDAVPREVVSAEALVLTTDDGASVFGSKPDSGARLVTRLSSDTGLPWKIVLKPIPDATQIAALESRRRLLAAGLGAIGVLLIGGGYLSWRTVQRELAVARIQTEFVAAVSHEFRTPLTSLQHVTELLEEDDELPAERRRTLYGSLGRSTARLRGLVESLLDFARMEDGRKPYDLQPLDPNQLVVEVIAEFERHAPAEELEITPRVASAEPLQCRADASALRHALWNLLDNAVKYSPTPHRIQVTVCRRETQVAIAVADQGFGIPARDRQDIFRKFVRGADAQHRGIKGTGLGLAMVSHVVSAHHGHIELESEEGRGSTFTILLPSVG